MLATNQGACSDPPDPDPAPAPLGIPRFSTAPQVRWAGPGDPVSRPLAVFVDRPHGPLDQLVSDPDVTTFLNDRFHAWFLVPGAAKDLPDAPAAWFVDPLGCLLGGPHQPASAAAWIEAANTAISAAPKTGETAPQPSFTDTEIALPDPHPLRGTCRSSALQAAP